MRSFCCGRSAPLVLAGTLLLGGCYAYTPLAADRPVPAMVVEATLNDRGRAAMENNIGSGTLTVLGDVETISDSTFVLRMRRTVTLDQTSVPWAGEAVTFRTDYVRSFRQRSFSSGRTVLLVGTATVGAVAFVSAGLNGFLLGSGGSPSSGGDGNHTN